MNLKNILFLLLVVVLSSGCVKYRSLLNYSGLPELPSDAQLIENYVPVVLQPADIVAVNVSSSAIAAAAPFNGESNGYLVDSDGNIELPTLGTMPVAGLTLAAAKDTIRAALRPYFTEKPIVNVRLLNFRVSVNGEVASPSIIAVPNGRITMIEAITQAGDFTSYSRRDSILVIREFEGERTFGYIDFNSADAFTSPYFYLQQNDVVYVKPSPLKTTTVRDPAQRILPYVSVVSGLSALIISVLRLRG